MGSTVKDSVTGYTGIAVARSVWMYGCARIGVDSQKLVKGKVAETQWLDEQRVEVLKAGPRRGERVDTLLGSTVKDSVTGFTGMVVAETEWLHRPLTMGVDCQKLVDGKLLETEWFDAGRLKVVKRGKPKVSADSAATSGGPQHDPRPRVGG